MFEVRTGVLRFQAVVGEPSVPLYQSSSVGVLQRGTGAPSLVLSRLDGWIFELPLDTLRPDGWQLSEESSEHVRRCVLLPGAPSRAVVVSVAPGNPRFELWNLEERKRLAVLWKLPSAFVDTELCVALDGGSFVLGSATEAMLFARDGALAMERPARLRSMLEVGTYVSPSELLLFDEARRLVVQTRGTAEARVLAEGPFAPGTKLTPLHGTGLVLAVDNSAKSATCIAVAQGRVLWQRSVAAQFGVQHNASWIVLRGEDKRQRIHSLATGEPLRTILRGRVLAIVDERVLLEDEASLQSWRISAGTSVEHEFTLPGVLSEVCLFAGGTQLFARTRARLGRCWSLQQDPAGNLVSQLRAEAQVLNVVGVLHGETDLLVASDARSGADEQAFEWSLNGERRAVPLPAEWYGGHLQTVSEEGRWLVYDDAEERSPYRVLDRSTGQVFEGRLVRDECAPCFVFNETDGSLHAHGPMLSMLHSLPSNEQTLTTVEAPGEGQQRRVLVANRSLRLALDTNDQGKCWLRILRSSGEQRSIELDSSIVVFYDGTPPLSIARNANVCALRHRGGRAVTVFRVGEVWTPGASPLEVVAEVLFERGPQRVHATAFSSDGSLLAMALDTSQVVVFKR